MRLKTFVKIAVVVIVIAVGGVIGFLSQLDPNDYRDDIAIALQDATGRTVTLGGALSIEKSLTPTLVVEDVTIANAAWSKTADMASIKSLEVEVELLPLLSGNIVVNRLVLDGGKILLETGGDGQANWKFESTTSHAASSSEAQQLAFKAVSIENTQITFRSAATDREDSLTVTDLELKAEHPADPLDISGSLELNGTTFTLNGTLKTLGSLVEGKRTEADLTLESDGLKVEVKGGLGEPGSEGFLAVILDVDLKSSDGLAPFDIDLGNHLDSATLTTKLDGGAGALHFKDLVATLDASTLKGEVRLDLTDTPALVSGTLNLDKLDLDAVTQSADANVEAADRVFPETPLPFDVLKLIDLKLKVEIGELKAQELSFTDLSSDVALQSGSLALDVLSFSLSGASVSGKASADADTQAVALSLKFDDLEMGDLLKTLDAPDRLSGKADVIVDVSGNGASLAAIAGTLDGKASVVMENGKLDAQELDLLVGGVATIIGSLFSKGVDNGDLYCLALGWDIKAGVASQTVMLLDTKYSTVTGSGEIYLAKETLDLKVVPHSKGVTLNLAVPINVRGTLLHPTFTPDEGALALHLGGLLGATLFPPAMLLSLGDLGSGDTGCSDANQPEKSDLLSDVGSAVGGAASDVGTALDGAVKDVGSQIDSLFE
jgi:uncharacterized protein involved in outer membrane biogenesis